MNDRFLMCAPNHFEVAYVINPWMEGNIAHCRNDKALSQWNALAALIDSVAKVEHIEPVAGVPDMVFTANAGLVLGNKFVLSHFRHPERQGEEPHFARWFREQGFKIMTMPRNTWFEGAGDALLDRRLPLLWMGYGHRTTLASIPLLESFLEMEIVPLKLVDERFYHLDTCFCPLQNGEVMYYPAAFDAASLACIEARVPPSLRIVVQEADALDFACNAVNSGNHIFLNRASRELVFRLQAHGYTTHQTELTEFMKAGGSAKCLTLKLRENQWDLPAARPENADAEVS